MAPMNAPPKATPTSYRSHNQSKKPPNKKITSSQSKSKMEIHVSGDNSVVMEFNSDSDDDDDDDNILRDLMSYHRPRQSASNGSKGGGRKQRDGRSPSAGKSMKQSGSDYGSIFSESDEDFCFVDAPTITKVVSSVVVCVCVCVCVINEAYLIMSLSMT